VYQPPLQTDRGVALFFRFHRGEIFASSALRCIRVKTLLSSDDARRVVIAFVDYYITVQLHSAIAYITPVDELAGRTEVIWSARKQKLATAAAKRRVTEKKVDHPEWSEIN
jgi:hypothetical protein